MTFYFTETTLTLSASASTVSAALSAVTTFLLLVLLCQRELMRVVDGGRSRRWAAILDTAIVPLLLTFGLIVVARLLILLDAL